MSAGKDLEQQIRAALAGAGDPAKAPRMQAYMKSSLPYYGVPVPEVRRIVRSASADWPFRDRAEWEDSVRALFDGAGHREDWYAALTLLRHRRASVYLDRDAMPLLEHLITHAAWWDVVDDAAHAVGAALAADRSGVEPVVRRWIGADDHWLRRAAIICQLGRRTDTDLVLLVDAIEAALTEREFFVRKAIGWALREYARTDPAWVRGFVADHDDELSGLSRREALKNL